MSKNKAEVKRRLFDFVQLHKQREFDPQTTFKQLMVKKTIVWSWGATEFEGLRSDGLVFKVHGRLHQGYVVITLGFMDTYDIHLLTFEGVQVGERTSDVYCDQLTDVIDNLVETPL